MSEARPIGELFPSIVARSRAMMRLQVLLNECATASRRKRLIMLARHAGLISDAETHLLIEAYQLETA